MKLFLKHTILFALQLIIILIAIRIWNNSQYPEKAHLPEIPNVALGDSHMMCAFNPAYFNNSKNFSQTAEPLIITFRKLQILTQQNPQLESVFIGLSYNTFSSYNDLKLSKKPWVNNQFKRVAGHLNLKAFKPLETDTTLYWRYRLKHLWMLPSIGKPTFFGAFKPKTPRLSEADLSKTLNRHFYDNNEIYKISQSSLSYLDSIIDWGKNNSQKIYLVELPVHPAYRKKVPNTFKKVVDSLARKNEELWLTPIKANSRTEFYHDYDHLNEKGAKQFTLELKSQLN